MEDYSILFSYRLRKARLDSNIKQNELAEKSGIAATTISAYENSSKSPSLENAATLADTLGVSLDWLCGIDNKETSQNKNQSIEIIKSLMLLMKKLNYDINTEIYKGYERQYVKLYYNSLWYINNVIDECNLIIKLEKSSNIITDEMVQTLENALIDKFKNADLFEENLPI